MCQRVGDVFATPVPATEAERARYDWWQRRRKKKRFPCYLRTAVNGGCLCPTSSLAPARPPADFTSPVENLQQSHRQIDTNLQPTTAKHHTPRSINSHTESLASSSFTPYEHTRRIHRIPPPPTHTSSQRTACEPLPTPQSWPTRDLRTSRRVSRACSSVATSQCACDALRASDWAPPRISQTIHVLTMLRAVAQIESNYDETTDSFDAMDLKPELLRGIYAYGFERPSAIQQRAIMPVIKGMCPHKSSPQSERKLTNNRQRCYRSGPVRYRQDRHLLHLCPPEDRPHRQGLPGPHPRSHP